MTQEELVAALIEPLDRLLIQSDRSLPRRLAEAFDDGLRGFMLQVGLRPAMWDDEWERARAAFLQSVTGPTPEGRTTP